MWFGGIGFNPFADFALRLSAYDVPNILVSAYTDAVWVVRLSENYRLTLGGQYMSQNSTGDELLTGSSFHTWSAGLKVDLTRGPLTLTLAHNRTGDRAAYRSPYGTWAGYTSMIVKDFDRAGERALLAGTTLDFAGVGVPGLTFNFAAVFGADAINPAGRVDLSENNEYNATFDYRFTSTSWPEWLRSFWIRARAARVEERLSGNNDVTMDYRVALNYEIVY
jgi:hypothetical protein